MPSHLKLLQKAPNEDAKAFNKRLRDACREMPVTAFEAHIVDGEPAVALMTHLVEADADMVKESDGEVREGEEVPENDPVVIQVARVGAFGKDAPRSEAHVATLATRAGEDLEEVRFVSGQAPDWIYDRNDLNENGEAKDPKVGKRMVMYMREVTWAFVVYLAPAPGAVEQDEAGER